MKFPEWAPTALVERYQSYGDDPGVLRHYDLHIKTLKKLTTDLNMKRVWAMLRKNRVRYKWEEHKPSEHGDGIMALHLFNQIIRAIHETERQRTTRSEDVLMYQEIANATRILAAKVSLSSLDVSPLHWFPTEAVNTMLRLDINPEKAAGYFCLVHDEGELHKKGGIYQEIRFNDGTNEYLRVAENTTEFFNKFCITPQYPSISKILESMANEAVTAAKHEEKRQRIASKSTITKTTIFIRSLYPFWHETFGGHLYRTFAALCRVVLDDSSIDEADIKDAVRNYKIQF